MSGPIASTPFGDVAGLERDGVLIFKGITYAHASRFAPPAPTGSWDGVLDATKYRPQCPQLIGTMERMLGASSLPMDEDCLHLNVFTSSCDGRRPVLVWIHGGAFVTGGGAMPWYDGCSLVRRGGVVVVTLNYRLGALGFLGGRDVGLADQIVALEWVRDAIASFGGDPDRVTIFGESAGGASVVSLLAAPAARDLFGRAFAMSPSIPQLRSTQRAAEVEARVLDAAGVSTVAELAALPLDDVLAAQGVQLASPAEALTSFAPTSGGDIVPSDILTAAGADPRPLVIGSTRDEMHLFTAFDPSRGSLDDAGVARAFERRFHDAAGDAIDVYRRHRPNHSNGQLVSAMQTDETFRAPAWSLADARVATGVPTWMYWFTWPTPAFGGVLGSCHGVDVPFAFHNLNRPGVAVFTGEGPEREHVADAFSGAVLQFATTDDPGWPRYDGEQRITRRIDVESTDVADPEPELRHLWHVRD